MSKDKFEKPTSIPASIPAAEPEASSKLGSKPRSKPRSKPDVNASASDNFHDAKSQSLHGHEREHEQSQGSQAQNSPVNQAGKGETGNASSQKEAPSAQPVKGPSQISNAVGAFQILPGESAEKYYHGLASTIDELGAKSIMQVYYAEKIFQCLWWMRRYETQKRSSIIKAMANELAESPYFSNKDQIMGITVLLEAGRWSDSAIQKLMNGKGHTAGSLLEHAMDRQKQELMELEQCIALKAATLLQLQKSYEVLVNRSVLHERMKLQNELLKRDLLAIDVTEVKGGKVVAQEALPEALEDAPQDAHQKAHQEAHQGAHQKTHRPSDKG